MATAVAIVGCSRNRPQIAPLPGETINFDATSGRDTILEGRFIGSAVVSDGWIQVSVQPTLTFPPGPRERWRSVTIRAFLAADYRPGGWKAPVASTPVNVWRYLDFPRGSLVSGRTSVTFTESLHFTVAIPPGASLATSRLGFEIEWVTLFSGYGQTEQNYAFSGPLTVAKPPAP